MRTITKTKTIYLYPELSKKAKERARQWWRELESQDFSGEFVLEDAVRIAGLFGLEINQERVFWSGFSSQGDGACFASVYRYKKGSVKAVIAYAPNDTELHAIIEGLVEVQRRNFYALEATTMQRGHYMHSGCMEVDVTRKDGHEMTEDAEEAITDLLRSFADWVYDRLEGDYYYQISDESAEDAIIANEYEFDEGGNPCS